MPINETIELSNLIADAANLSTETTIPSGTNASQLSLYRESDGIILDDSLYNEDVGRRLRDIELKTYTTNLKYNGYPINPPLIGDRDFTDLLVVNPKEPKDCSNPKEKYEWVVTNLCKQVTNGTQYINPNRDNSLSLNSTLVNKLAEFITQEQSDKLKINMKSEDVTFNTELLKLLLQTNLRASPNTPSLVSVINIADANNFAPIEPIKDKIGELLTPIVGYAMEDHLINWETEVGKTRVFIGQSSIGHILQNISKIEDAYHAEEEGLRGLLPNSRVFGHNSLNFLPTLQDYAKNSKNPTYNYIDLRSDKTKNETNRQTKIIWICGGTIGIVCIGVTIIGIIGSSQPTGSMRELTNIINSSSILVNNVSMFLVQLKNKFK